MPKRGKKYLEMVKKLEKREYTPEEAIKVVKELTSSNGRKFEETVEVAVALNIKPKEKGERVRGTVSLPRGLGRKVRVLVFAAGDQAEEAKKAGADFVGGEDLIQKIEKGWLDFDAVVATPQLMRSVARLGRILGPKGLMPSPKIGTVTDNPGKVVEELKRGKIEYRNDATGVIHAPIGKVSFSEDALLENFYALLKAIEKDKPSTVKGRYIKSIYISSTMGPGIKVKYT
ncbi:MAG TPA: 50S ribosomal protein L1 [Candidatus Aerophobetes bacterium]|uniref:Large ribosomal subunit protein uL1 n=1 Tax=Aerophobetes bacterium TaxID=2030807 RepID=A0A7V5LZS8_UNCAE|nr:50S ribosomal protein L1 [Candidatus Aerophobetes bacterium]